MLADVYDDVDPSGFWISEKYDGVRAYWDGKHLVTRAGNTIHAPEWFTRDWPTEPLDGERRDRSDATEPDREDPLRWHEEHETDRDE
jgi:ATP-dependent DNA ligase